MTNATSVKTRLNNLSKHSHRKKHKDKLLKDEKRSQVSESPKELAKMTMVERRILLCYN